MLQKKNYPTEIDQKKENGYEKEFEKIQILDHTHRFKEFEEIYPELYDGSVCICSSAGCKGAGEREPDRGDTECHDSFMDTGK